MRLNVCRLVHNCGSANFVAADMLDVVGATRFGESADLPACFGYGVFLLVTYGPMMRPSTTGATGDLAVT